jgi:hypothetical protein
LYNCSPDFSENKENEINSIKSPARTSKRLRRHPGIYSDSIAAGKGSENAYRERRGASRAVREQSKALA